MYYIRCKGRFWSNFLRKFLFVLPVDSVLGRRLTRGDCDLGDIRGLSNCKEEESQCIIEPHFLVLKMGFKRGGWKKGNFLCTSDIRKPPKSKFMMSKKSLLKRPIRL